MQGMNRKEVGRVAVIWVSWFRPQGLCSPSPLSLGPRKSCGSSMRKVYSIVVSIMTVVV